MFVSNLSASYVGKAMVAYTSPNNRRKKKVEAMRRERDQTKFIDLRLKREQIVGFGKGGRRQDVACSWEK